MKRLTRLIVFALIVFGAVALCSAQGSTPRTCWGWIKGHSEIDGGTVKSIRGKVVDPSGESVAGALIEVFAYNDADIDKRTVISPSLDYARGSMSYEEVTVEALVSMPDTLLFR